MIREGALEQHRPTARETPEVQDMAGLRGIRAHTGSGRELREALKGVKDRPGASLFAETVRGIIQAETYLYRERGFSSLEEYSRHWDDFYAGGCRFYSNRARVQCTWDEYVKGSERKVNLFNRFKSQHLYRQAGGNYSIYGTVSDSFHEMSIYLEISAGDGRVVSAAGPMLRVPDEVCRESAAYLDQLHGQKLAGMPKKDIAAILGREQGCVHLIDITHDAAETLSLQ